jgi:hypothetical protein
MKGKKKLIVPRNILAACGIEVGTDFRSLSTSQIDVLVAHAEQHRLNKYGTASGYRRPPRHNDFAVQSLYDLLRHSATHRFRPLNSIPGVK